MRAIADARARAVFTQTNPTKNAHTSHSFDSFVILISSIFHIFPVEQLSASFCHSLIVLMLNKNILNYFFLSFSFFFSQIKWIQSLVTDPWLMFIFIFILEYTRILFIWFAELLFVWMELKRRHSFWDETY